MLVGVCTWLYEIISCVTGSVHAIGVDIDKSNDWDRIWVPAIGPVTGISLKVAHERSVGGVQGIADEYISGGADIGSCSPMVPSSTPSKERPADIEGFRLILPSTLVGGVVHPGSKLKICSDGIWCAVEYDMFLSSIRLWCICCMSWGAFAWAPPLCSDLGLPARLEGEYRHSIPHARQREHMGRALEHLTFAKKHPSHEARSRGWRALVEAIAVPICIDVGISG